MQTPALSRQGEGPGVCISGVCTLVGSSGRASVAQGCTLGWGMFGPRGADASGYALGGFDKQRRVRTSAMKIDEMCTNSRARALPVFAEVRTPPDPLGFIFL